MVDLLLILEANKLKTKYVTSPIIPKKLAGKFMESQQIGSHATNANPTAQLMLQNYSMMLKSEIN
uniref:Uncharacterized protein n=1 Tax=Rhizophora mucronata TaxID=61149 RepID=A0A2P2NYV2_RHIMU